jgi:hypothetical protein
VSRQLGRVFEQPCARHIFIVRDRKDKAHELAILDKQMAFMEKSHHNRIAEIGAMADANDSQYISNSLPKVGIQPLTPCLLPFAPC